MSKSIGRIAAAVSTGGLSEVARAATGGGGSNPLSSKPKFIGSTRDVDKSAFEIKEAEESKKRAQAREQEATERSKTAQEQRQGLISQLQAQASGEAPSLAEAQLKAASDRNLAQQLAVAQTQRGGSASARERNLARAQAQSGRELAQDVTTAGIQERQQAQNLLAQQISQEQQLADQLTQNYLAQGFTIEQAQQQALADFEKLETNQFLSAQGLTAASTEAGAQRQAGLIGGIFSAGSGLGAAAISDKNEKKNIKKAKKSDMIKMKNKDENKTDNKNEKLASAIKNAGDQVKETMSSGGIDAVANARSVSEKHAAAISDKNQKKNIKKGFLDALTAYTYEYKNPKKPGAGEGRHLSVMAQDLEKTDIGKNMVKTMNDGTKIVDYGKGFGAILAAQAHLNKRLEEIEKKSKRKK